MWRFGWVTQKAASRESETRPAKPAALGKFVYIHYRYLMQLRKFFMPRATQHPKETSFNLRIDQALKSAFTAATEAEDKPAAQVVRDFMRAYVQQRERRAFATEARRQSLLIAERARDPGSDEAAVMREIDADLEHDAFSNEWKA